jgi:hypothetical protein
MAMPLAARTNSRLMQGLVTWTVRSPPTPVPYSEGDRRPPRRWLLGSSDSAARGDTGIASFAHFIAPTAARP